MKKSYPFLLGLFLLLVLRVSQGVITEAEIQAAIGGDPLINGTCSENVELVSQGSYDPSIHSENQTNCPHSRPDLSLFVSEMGRLAGGQTYNISNGQRLLFTPEALPLDPDAIVERIVVEEGAELIFDDADMSLNIRELFVGVDGHLWIGSEECKLYASLTITFHGSRGESSTSGFSSTGKPSKGIQVLGKLDIHGKLFHPTWTRLASSARAGDDIIFLVDNVNWEVGQEVLITTSTYSDCPEQWESYCQGQKHQNEVATIIDLYMDPETGIYALKLHNPLTYFHYAGQEYQAEVALLSRRILLQGDEVSSPTESFGGHVTVTMNGEGRISGVKGYRMGQKNVLARYPFHFHMLGDQGSSSYCQDCQVHDSYFRSYVIHGTNHTMITRSTSYHVLGPSFSLETGSEENNLLSFNLAAQSIPIFQPAGETKVFSANPELIIPADTAASCFYISNANNEIIGNAASGGWAGFLLPSHPLPLTESRTEDWGNLNPVRRPTKTFYGNTAHSSAFYWSSSAAIHVGTQLYYDGDALTFDLDAPLRDTVDPDGTKSFISLNHTVITNLPGGTIILRGPAAIGNLEAHDVTKGVTLFGEAFISNALINRRSGNPNTFSGEVQPQTGFEYYDISVKTILNGVTFRNFDHKNSYAIVSLTHSDHFKPQGINAVRSIKFENVGEGQRFAFENPTGASRYFNILDYDGSAFSSFRPSILGANHGWWDLGEGCEFLQNISMWRCDWTDNRDIAQVALTIDGLMEGCIEQLGCDGDTPLYTVGSITQWGAEDKSISLSPQSVVSGHANTGWVWRPKQTDLGINGPPRKFGARSITNFRSAFVVLAVRYPSSATFNVVLEGLSPAARLELPMSTKEEVTSKTEPLIDSNDFSGCDLAAVGEDGQTAWNLCTNTGGVGPAWHFDGSFLYLRIVDPGFYTSVDSYKSKNWAAFAPSDHLNVNPENNYQYTVEVTSCDGCTIQTEYQGVTYFEVPEEIPPSFEPEYGTLRITEDPVYATSRDCPGKTFLPNTAPLQIGRASCRERV